MTPDNEVTAAIEKAKKELAAHIATITSKSQRYKHVFTGQAGVVFHCPIGENDNHIGWRFDSNKVMVGDETTYHGSKIGPCKIVAVKSIIFPAEPSQS